MNPKVHVDAEVIKIIYLKYKEYLWPLCLFIISWFVFLQFAIPQIQSFLATKDEVAASEQTLATITQNYNTLISLNNNDLKQNTTIATQALPITKDFAGVLTGISNAAGLSGVVVSDYSFAVGDINGLKLVKDQTIKVTLNLQGNTEQIKKFLTSLQNLTPLSEVTEVNILGDTSAQITANFYYSTLPKITFIDTNPLPQLAASQKQLLKQFSEVNNIPESSFVTPIATPEATITVTPTIASSSSSLQ